MKEKSNASEIIISKWLYLAIIIAVACAIWATDFSSVAEVSTYDIVNNDVLSASQMHDSESPYDYVDGDTLVIEPGDGYKIFVGKIDLNEGDVLQISFTAVNKNEKEANLIVDLYADGFDDPYDEISISIMPGEEKVRKSIEYYREDHPNQCDVRIFTPDDASLEIRDIEIDQVVIDKQGNSPIKVIAKAMRMIAIAAFILILVLVFLQIKSSYALQDKEAKKDRTKDVLLYLGVMLAVTTFLAVIYRYADIYLPLVYQNGDEMGVYYYSKMIDQNGLSLVNQFTGGLTGADMFDYPYSDKLSFTFVRLIGLFTDNPYLITNLFYFVNFYLVAIISSAVARALGVSHINSAVIGLLFAFSPYMQMRYTHLWLTPYYMIPVACLLCIHIMKGWIPGEQDQKKKKKLFWGGMILSFACAFTGMYYAYFACAIFAASMVIRMINTQGRGLYKELYPIAYIGSTILGVVINTVPNLLYWQLNGSNPAGELAIRSRGDAEVYALKLVQMIIPRQGHRIGLFRRIAEGYQRNYPLVNENMTAALGIIASIGLLISLLLIFSEKNKYKEISWLNLSVFIIATIGGIGSIISVAVVIPMRCYNRMSLIIMFLSLLLVGLLLDRLKGHIPSSATIAISLCVLVAGMYDQTIDYLPYDTTEIENTKELIARVEEETDNGDFIFVLPYTNWPSADVTGAYGQFIGYIETVNRHWSCGAMQGRGEAEWQDYISGLDTGEMLAKLRYAGYSGIYLDRSLYEAKYGEDATSTYIAAITQTSGTEPLISKDGDKYFWKIDQSG